ncbi:hypothetical protein N7450_007983 [Penicillium hetheringtonii]|uniref:Zn(2)-C6 fungal-type domain-containing protein n=1 Tax=Penicillium hetheringtonii TaxID=911720 RepID=A0AAD6DFL3_9EURO|nr:hypothetical protein N7450_007983 [Penicillium hetheringtonii]
MSADQACVRCRKQKRKCDRILPCCALCKRLNKHCVYQLPEDAPRLLAMPDWADLKLNNLGYTLELQVSAVIGDGLKLQEAAALYFRTIHTWFPIVSEKNYHARLANTRVQTNTTPPELSLLTLCMALVCKEPIAGVLPDSTWSLYVSIKGFVGLLEVMGANSLEMIQSRILLTTFEIGHAVNDAACISAAANLRAAFGLNLDSLGQKSASPEEQEEIQNVRYALLIVDSYASLESGQPPSTQRGRPSSDTKDVADVELNAFPKLARASKLLDWVLIHLYATSPQDRSSGVEGVAILKCLTSFMTTFQNVELHPHPLSDSALAISRSAMIEALELGSHMINPDNYYCVLTSVNILKSLVHEVGLGGKTPPPVETAAFPVFIAHCLFKAAMVCLCDTRVSGGIDTEPFIQPMKTLLGYLGHRWVAASRCSNDFDSVIRTYHDRKIFGEDRTSTNAISFENQKSGDPNQT